MGAFDDLIPRGTAPSGAFDDLVPRPAAADEGGGPGTDLLKSLKVGAQKLPGQVAGLLDIPAALTSNDRPISRAADWVGEKTGFQPGKWAKDTQFSPGYEASRAEVDAAWKPVEVVAADPATSKADVVRAFADNLPEILKRYGTNPMYSLNQVAESVPGMVAGGVASRGLMTAGRVGGVAGTGGLERVAGKWAAPIAGGVGEGAQQAGQVMDEYTGPDQRRAAVAALASGGLDALIAAGGGRIANRLGLETPETAMAKLGDRMGSKSAGAALGVGARVAGGAASEGIFQELPQSMQEQAWQNWADGKPLGEGVLRAGIEGGISGGIMGAGANVSAPRAAVPAAAAPAVDAAEVLGRPAPAAPEPSDAEKALTAAPSELLPERITAVPGAPTTFSTEAGSRLEGQYALVEAGEVQASHDTELRPNPRFPAELQPRDRTRAASEAQIQGIVGRLDPARLGLSADAGTGAPIIGEDGLVESGNARTIALQRVYGANGQKAHDYRTWLRDNAATFGLAPDQVDGMRQPMLVRVRSTPVDRAEFARQANASTVATMSPLEQARADAARIDSMDDLRPDDRGEFSTSRDFIRRFVGRLPATEQGGMIDASGQLSSSGYARVRNAVLAKAYGNSPVLSRMVESMDDSLRNVSRALMMAAPRVAQIRGMVEAGRLHAADVTPDLIAAVSELERIKQRGGSVSDALAQRGLDGDRMTPEQRQLLQFLDENLRRPRRIADFIGAYADALEAAGDPNQGNLLGEAKAPTVKDLLTVAMRETAPPEPTAGPAAQTAQPSQAANDAAVDGDWRSFGPETGTLGVPRSEMPQVKMKDRPALFDFLQSRGIGHQRVSLDAESLKPTQAEYSEDKTNRAAEITAADDPRNQVLVSSDGYIIDGHHRWLATSRSHGQVNAVQFDAPAGRVLDAMMQFPGTTVSRESAGALTPSARDLAVQDLKAALGDLGDFLTRHARAALIEGDKPKLMPILVRTADAAIRIVGTDLRKVVAWMRDAFRSGKEKLPGWNKMPATWYREAAEQALASLQDRGQQMGLFDDAGAQDVLQGDLFSQPLPEAGADPEAAAAEKLAPLLKLAGEAKPDFDQRVTEIAGEAGGRAQLAPLKSMSRAAQKVVNDYGGDEQAIKDLLRATIVVNSYSDAPAVVERLRSAFDVVQVKDKLSDEARERNGGYADMTVFVRMPNGVKAEVQINTPAMLKAKERGHKLYEAARTMSAEEAQPLLAEMRKLYDEAFEKAGGLSLKATPPRGAPARPGASPVGSSSEPSSENLSQRPSGNITNSSPPKVGTNTQPSGNLPGTSMGLSTAAIVPLKGEPGYTAAAEEKPDVGAADNRDQGDAASDGSAGRDARAGDRQRRGAGRAGPAASGEVGPAGADRVRSADADGAQPERRGAAGAGSGVPAGRDIPVKSGRNYRFTDADLSYAGSWPVRAQQNIDAVALLKQLQAEGRQATRDEQSVLAKFNGWGASEMANRLFGKDAEQVGESLKRYQSVVEAAKGKTEIRPREEGYWSLYEALTKGNHSAVRYGDAIPVDKITPAAFGLKPDSARWAALRSRLKELLTAEEWADAARTTQYAHFTSKAIVDSMWGAMRRFGFGGGAILEPGAGNGVFPGLMPAEVAANSSYTGVEFDPITGGMLKQLQPDERILVESFVDSKLPRDFFDVAVGNPPFSSSAILADPDYKKHAFSLHDYFFAKTIDRVKPGGLVAFVTSRYTMDKQGDKARAYLAERADLVGAIRLPQTAFKKNAGTEVVTDVMFLRKKVPGETFEYAHPWLKAVPVKTKDGDAVVNEYFAAHPEMVLGTPALAGSMYSKNEYTVLPPDGDIEALFSEAVDRLPADIYKARRGSAAEAAQVREIDWNPTAKKEGNYYVTEKGALMQRDGGVGRAVELRTPKQVEIIKAFVPLRDALKQAQHDQLNGGDWESSLKALQAAYKKFVKAHGQINQFVLKTRKLKVAELDDDGNPTGRKIDDETVQRVTPLLSAINDDPDYTLVMALEEVNEETGVIKPSAFLTGRVLGERQPARIDTPQDALLTVLNDTGRVDVPAIAQLAGMSETDAVAALSGAIFLNPEGQAWDTADAYLSGNVKRKLEVAREAAKSDRRFEGNVTALEAVQPAPKSPAEISVSLGMNWIPASDYEQFLKETAGVRAAVRWNDASKAWSVSTISGWNTMQATADWGTGERNAAELLEHALTGRPIRITRTVKNGASTTTVFMAEATEAANEKLGKLRAEFEAWIWRDAERTDRLVREYNDRFNTTVPRAFDGRHLTLPGSSTQFHIFDHVKRGAWRIIQSGNTYLAHAVGSGKTFQMVISAMEQKRLGMIQKPMVVVPNHMLLQFAREWQQLYPAARLMVADEQNFHTDNRRRFVSRVALSDLDGVIITHSAFKLLDIDPDFKSEVIQRQLDVLEAALSEAEDSEGKRSPTVKQIQRQIESLEQKLEAAMSSAGKDKNARFDELGVDMLYVDEAHEFRKLDFATARQVKGIQPGGSARALDLYIKTRWLEQKHPGRSLVMASGTPITNTVAELYTVNRFMDEQALIDRGIEDFDSWAAMFGRERTELEPDAAGRYTPVTRFSKFVNVPELTQMFRAFADVVTADQLALLLGDKRPKVDGGARQIIVTPKTKGYAAYQKVLAERVEISRKWKPTKEQPNNPDPMIRIIGDGRLAAIDMRFITPGMPNDPDSKLNKMADDVIAAFHDTAESEYLDKATGQTEPAKGATLIVFSDLGFGAGVAASRGFNARAWFEKRLRDGGIPAAKVAFMSDYKKSTDKAKLFKDVNAGRVRILIGSSKNMGTGVNAQQRLRRLFHLDSPWYPADLEQREGRIVRQGNKNKVVGLNAYATKGTYDENMWKMLASKQMFISQALSGDQNLREIEDLDSQSQFDLAAALVAEDPRVIQLAGAKAEVDKLNRLFIAHEDQRMSFRERYRSAQAQVQFGEAQLRELDTAAARVQNLAGDNFKAKAGGTTYTERAKWGQALIDQYKALFDKFAESQKVGEISGFPVVYQSVLATGGDKSKSYRARIVLDTPIPRVLVDMDTDSAMSVATQAVNGLVDVARAPERVRQSIDAARATQDALRERLDTPFPMAAMLTDKRAEVDRLTAELEAAGKDRTWRVERADTGLGFDVQARSEQEAIEKAVASNGGAPADWRATEGGEPAVALLSRGGAPAGGVATPAVQAMADRVAKHLKNLPRVHVLASPAEAPAALRDFIEQRGAMATAEGALHDGEIYLFASNLADETRAEHVLAEHEAAHAGLRGLLGASLGNAMRTLYEANPRLRNQAEALIQQGLPLAEAVEEVIVDIPSAELATLKGWRRFVQLARDALRRAGLVRLALQLDRWLAGTLTEQRRADVMVGDLVREARAFVTGRRRARGLPTLQADAEAQGKWLEEQAKARGFKSADDMIERDYPAFDGLAAMWRAQNPAPVLSTSSATLPAPGARTTAERAEAIIQTAAGTPKPVDAFARTLTRITGLQRLTAATYGMGARLLDQLVPERVKAGVVSNYGIPEAVIDRRAAMQGTMRRELQAAGHLIDKLATLTRAESRVAYEWMNGDDTRAADEIMADLPEESVAVLRQVRTMIDDLSKEAVRLGQLDAGAFERHRFAYLRRTYFKYAQEMTGTEKAGRQRAISILGDQYKGRGIVEPVAMAKIQNAAPDWWQRKLQAGKADTSLKGQKFERLELRAHKGAGVPVLDGMAEDTRPPKLRQVVYWPEGEPKPAKYADWDSAGTFEVRDVKGGDAIMWRDFTKAERVKMGEIDEARYAIGKTLQRMVHDVEVGRYLEWLSQNHAKLPGEPIMGNVVEASERYRDTFARDEWVQVPATTIPGTAVKKYGKLAGQFLPGPIWNDLRQTVGRARFGPEWWRNIMTMWKLSKTALSPVVHTNNVMSNFVMADWHDVSAGHVAKALRIILAAHKGDGRGVLGRAGNVAGQLGIADRAAAREILDRYQASGGSIGSWVTSEIAAEQLAPIVKQLQDELAAVAGNAAPQEIGVYSALQHLLHARFPQAWGAFKASRPASAVATDTKNLIELYQSEDDVFRLAAWLRAKEEGQSDLEAGKLARRSFLDYDINAPWISAARQSALPFISFTYRAVPMLVRTAAQNPHKIIKLMAIAGALNMLGGMLAGGGGGDDDEVRKMLPDEKAGGVWGMVPKLIRMPWNDAHGSPVFLDIRRWIPVGDVFDLGQSHGALPVPPWLMPGGPLAVLGELLLNRSAFTGKSITLETDTVVERAAKVADHLWKAFAPNIVAVPGTYAWQGVADAARGRTDAFGREQSVGQALASSIGVKVGSYPPDVLRRNLEGRAKAQIAEIEDAIRQLKRQRMTNRIDQDEFEDEVRAQREKQRQIVEDLREKVN